VLPQKHPLVHDNEQCKPIVIETIKFLYDLDMEDGKDVDLTNPIARPRVPHEIMFVVGGWSGGSPTNVIETYDTRADRWITVEHADRGTSNNYYCYNNNKIIMKRIRLGVDFYN